MTAHTSEERERLAGAAATCPPWLAALPVWLQHCDKRPHYSGSGKPVARHGTLDSPEDRSRLVTLPDLRMAPSFEAGYALGPVGDLVLCGLDFDRCLDAHGKVVELLRLFCKSALDAGAMLEVSRSGAGLHVVWLAHPDQLPPTFKRPGMECYTGRRFFAWGKRIYKEGSGLPIDMRPLIEPLPMPERPAPHKADRPDGIKPPGGRNNYLRERLETWQLAGLPVKVMHDALLAENDRLLYPLDEHEIESTLAKGIDKLRIRPRRVPSEDFGPVEVPPDASQAPARDPLRPDGVRLTSAADVKPEAIRWLRRHKLAAGKLHILAGRPSTAKSTIAVGLAATVSTGGEWPEGGKCERGRVVIWSGEDAANDTIVPRLMAAGADLSAIDIVTGVQKGDKSRPFNPATDMAELHRVIAERGDVRLLIIDPVVAVVGAKQDSHKNSETRSALQPVVDLAEALDIAVVGISHFTKGTAGSDPIERVTGSLAFGALPRVIFATVKVADEVNKFRFVVAKSNIGPEGGGVEYSTRVVQLPGEIETTCIAWGAALEGDARKLIGEVETEAAGRPPEKLDRALQLLSEQLAHGPVPVKELKKAAEAHGIGWRTTETAKKALGVVTEQIDPNDRKKGWQWRRVSPFAEVDA